MSYMNSQEGLAARIVFILHDLDPDALCYVDDIYLMDDELNSHLARVDFIILGVDELGYKFNFKKSNIAFLSVLFLGYELTNEGQSCPSYYGEMC